MNEVKLFENEDFGLVRTVIIDGAPWFVAKDVAIALGYKNTNQSVKDNTDEDDRRGSQIMTPYGNQNMVVLNESGLYSLILRSQLPTAKKFKHWVTSEVLPSIRKTGGYALQKVPDSYAIEDPVERAKRWIEEQEEHNERIAEKDKVIAEKDEKIAELEPDADCFRKLCDTRSLICFRDAANLLGMSQTQFTGYLVREKYIYKKGKEDYRPTEPYRKSDLFRTKSYVNRNSGYSGIQTCLTPKGLQYFKLAFEAQGIFPDALPKHGGRNAKKK